VSASKKNLNNPTPPNPPPNNTHDRGSNLLLPFPNWFHSAAP
jgi:hypothetical protein